MKDLQNLVVAIAHAGKGKELCPPLSDIHAFRHFFANGVIDRDSLDERDGSCTRRELLLRMLVLNAVLDQGPDIEGVRDMMVQVINTLYEKEIRIFHSPLDFFKEINISVDDIWNTHAQVKSCRAAQWAEDNQSSESKYNLFMDNSKQTLNYAIFRWGVPLALSYFLSKCNEESPTSLIDYLESYESAEIMSHRLKDHERFGLGKAIGDKACHLFAKWMVSTFQLTRRHDETSWGEFSYETPYDSNAGRVLWRTGYLSKLASETKYKNKQVIQPGKGKGGTNYIRVTNIRGMKVETDIPPDFLDVYDDICVNHLRSHTRKPKTVEIQRFQHALLREKSDRNLTIAAFDDGLIEIGRNYCLNHENPRCADCPINEHCEGYTANNPLITNYRT